MSPAVIERRVACASQMLADSAFTSSLPPWVWGIAALMIAWVAIFFIDRLFIRKDFGVPVRRKIFCTHLDVHLDQEAVAPFWWTDAQIRHAVKSHWKRSLRQGHDLAGSATTSLPTEVAEAAEPAESHPAGPD